ncbi:MAG TPA: protein kinase [Candidatus Limnocylindrales bacterium]|nr:protein kinase [Candidatus Limnocylindrales bacterium]
MATQTQSFLQGEVVDGKFELRQYLGGSDHGAVFLTECGGIKRHEAAIKLIPARAGNAELQLSHWRLAANISHSHLLKIFDMGRCEVENTARLYAVMERADENLAEILPERALTPAEARDMLVPVLDALAYMHSRGFVHGRVRPSNIMAVGEELKLSSDSICRLGESIETQGVASPYDAPEGARSGLSPAGDVWALGMTLVEILTQRLPEWDPAERKDPILPETMPAPFADIARHCLRREPKNRWTVADVAAHLPATIEPAPAVSAPAKKAIPVDSTAIRRYSIGIAAAALVIVAIVAGGKILGSKSDVARATADAAPAPVQPVEPTRAETPAPRPAEPEKRPAISKHVEPAKVAPAAIAKHIEPVKAPPVERAAEAVPSRATAAAPSPAPPVVRTETQPTVAAAVPGEVLHRVLPTVPQKSSNTISGTVRVGVKVSVDAAGNVIAATLDSAGPSRYFANLSLAAAREWKFAPAKANGTNVASEWLLRFGYTKSGPEVLSTKALP